ncbi:MAG: hypothetical protein Q7J84_18990 [Sulfuricaulis sp.]|nr:hypothetical protein [Sulfuricaulis sp.]
MFGHGYFGAGYYGPGYWGPGTSAPVVVLDDTHDGFDEARKRKESEFRSARERLREVLDFAWEQIEPSPVALEVKALAASHVERMESGALRIDYAALERQQAALLAFHAELRREYEARRADEDEEDVEILTVWS